jgi:hypothetical protein
MHGSKIPIWFFIGVLLFIYGVMIFSYGIYQAVTGDYPQVQLVHLHTPIWWGATLTAIGVFYLVKFRPGRVSQ